MFVEIEKPRLRPKSQSFFNGIRPAFLNEFDYPLILKEIEFLSRFHGRKRREYEEALAEKDRNSAERPSEHVRYTRAAIKAIAFRSKPDKKVIRPSSLRMEFFMRSQSLFSLGHTLTEAKELVLAEFSHGTMTEEQFGETLFADMAKESKIDSNKVENCLEKVVEIANKSLLKRILRQSLEVSFLFDGNVKNVVRTAKLRGLICQMSDHPRGGQHTGFEHQDAPFQNSLRISGAISIFQQTSIYADALYSLLSQVCYADRYIVFIEAYVQGNLRRFRLQSGDAFRPGKAPKLTDSRVEQRFLREAPSLLRDWEIVREPFAVSVGNCYLFPDFLLKNKLTREDVVFEIVGYWRLEYLRKKLDQYEKLIRENRSMRIVLCANRKYQEHFSKASHELLQGTLFYDNYVCVEALSRFLATPATLFTARAAQPGRFP